MARSAGNMQPPTVNLVHLDTISSWLRKHGKPVRPRLDRKQLEALRECFDIIDTDSTGTITAEELRDVFKSLGDHVSLQAVATVLDSVRYHGSSGIGFTDFIDIMSRDSQDLKEDSHNRSNGNATTAYNIALMARAYRRKKVMEAVFKDEGGWRARFVHMHERIKAKERHVKSRLMTESMMPLTLQASMLDVVGMQTSEENIRQVEQIAQSDSSLAAPSGSVFLPRTRIRLGTGVLPVITQSLNSELPVDAQPSAGDMCAASQSSASGHVIAPSQLASMLLPAEEPALRAEQKGTSHSLASDTPAPGQTSAGSMQGTSRSTGRGMQGTSRLMASEEHTVGQSLEPDLEAADSAEGHVWGAVHTQTDIDNEQSEESVRPVREKKSVHVTPRTRQKLQWLQDTAEAVTPLSWQLKQQQQQQQSQPASFSMQLQPVTDSGNTKVPHEVAEKLVQACCDASEPGSSMRQVCSSKECHGKPLSQSALSAVYARQAYTFAFGGADVTQLASSSTLRSPAGRSRSVAIAAGGSIDSDLMASWPDATAGDRDPMRATVVSVKGLPAQGHQVSSELAHTRHASPRNMLRQAAFLGQPHDFPPADWNTSINPHSSRHASEPIALAMGATAMDADPSTAAATSAKAVEGASTATSRSTAVVCKAMGSRRPHVPSLGLAALRADRHRKGLQTLHGRVTAGQHQGPCNNADSSAADGSHSARERPAGHSLAFHFQMAKEDNVSYGKAPDAPADRHPPAAPMSRPRSSVWASQSTVSQQVLDQDEQPVTYRAQRSSLLPTPQSSRAPWLHTAAVTAGRFKQHSRAQTTRSARQHSFPMQAEPVASGRGTDRSTGLSRRLALQQRLDVKPVAVHQQIRRETQAQVRLLAKQQGAQPALYT
ncbi:TPA: hypothetical protein ACH3X1_001915 [Trebouxia sp. C0004]